MPQISTVEDLRKTIRDIPDFPKEGILFKDITTLLKDKEAFRNAIDRLAEEYQDKDIDYVTGVEARGFIFGAALAYKIGAGFIPIRKKGKLPSKTRKVTYALEYGTDTLEIHEDALDRNSRVLIVDDLLATGGTVKAVCDLIKGSSAKIVGICFLVELEFLKGKDRLKDFDVFSLIKF